MHIDPLIRTCREGLLIGLPTALIVFYTLLDLALKDHNVLYSLFGALIMGVLAYAGLILVREIIHNIKEGRAEGEF